MKTKMTGQLLRVVKRQPRTWGLSSIPCCVSWLLLFAMMLQGAGCPLAGTVYASGRARNDGARRTAPPSTGGRTATNAPQAVETVYVFGPKRFERKSGPPTTYTEQFTVPAGVGAPFSVFIQNGDDDGGGRVSSATVKLNGSDLYTQKDFNQSVASLTRQVALAPTNTLEVRLTSAVGSFIVVSFTALRTQAPTPSLTSATPNRAAQGQTLSVVLRGSNTHFTQGQTRASFGGEVSVGGAPAGELGLVNVTDATTATAEVSVSPTAALAPRNVRVVTPGQGASNEESVSLVNAFTVVSSSPPGAESSRVSTLAGAAGAGGFADGQAAQARFNNPQGVAVGADESIYVADAGNNRVRLVRLQGTAYVVSTLAGDGTAGFADGPASQSRFNNPQGVAVGASGVVYVADTDNHRIRRVGVDGAVTTLAGDGTPGFANGAGSVARFNAPRGLAVDGLGNVYVADTGNASVRRVAPDGTVATLAGDGSIGSNDTPPARFDGLTGIAWDGEHVLVYVADSGNHRIRRLDASGATITIAGSDRGFADGTAAQARFAEPSGVALDGSGKVVVADAVNSLIRLVDALAVNSSNAVSTLAGAGERGGTDGAGNVARFNTPRGLAVTLSSSIVVADTGNNTLRRVLLPPLIDALSPNQARPGQQISILGQRFDGRAPSRNTVRFTRAASAGGGLTPAVVVSASRTALTVEVPADAADGPVTVETEGGSASSPEDFILARVDPPAVTDFDPKRGPVGTAVTITGTNLTADGNDPAVTFLGAAGARLPALVTSASATQVRVLVPNGAITGNIELTNAGGRAVSPSPFTVESEQDFQLTIAPSTSTAIQGGTGTFLVSVTSIQPSFTQMAALTAEGLPEGVAAVFEPPRITGGSRSTLNVALGSSGLSPGSYPFTVKAVADADGRELTKTATATLNVLPAGQTTLSGRVLSTESEPIMGATVSLDGRTATTDAAGSFILSGVTAGSARPLMIDGRTASAPNRTYPLILEPANIVAGQANVVPYTYYLPPIDTQYEVEVVPGQNTNAGNPRLPGLQMTIPAGANLRNRDGSPVTRVSITPLAIDRTPTPLPDGIKTNVVYTSQPGGAVTNIAIPVVYPNLAGRDPGTRIELYAFDHDLVRWYVYGFGRVSDDGKTIAPETDPATGRPYGLRDFSWHFPNAGPDGNPEGDDGKDKDCSDSSTGGNPVNFATGMKMEKVTDVYFGGTRGGLELTRVYTSDMSQACDFCPFGRGATHNYDVRVTGNFSVGGAGRVRMPEEVSGRLFSYAGTDTSGALVFATQSTVSQLGDVLRRLSDGTYEYRKEDGTLMRFNSGGRLTGIVDRHGNTTTLSYTGSNLTRVTDAVGRTLTLDYDFNGRITRVTDALNRAWRYTYEGTPGVAGGPGLTTVTDPLNQVWRYTYVTGGRLSVVTDPRGNRVKQITYDGNGRVTRQEFADGGAETYDYTLSGGLVTSVVIKDPLGRKTTKRFNASGYVLSSTDSLGQTATYTRDIATNLSTSTSGPCGCPEATRKFDARGNVLEETDRSGRTEKREYDPNFPNISKVTDAAGRTTNFTYDSRGNLLTVTNAKGQTTTSVYDAFGQLTTLTDPLGHTVRMEYDAFGNLSAFVDALNDRWTFEYDAAGRMLKATDPLGRHTSATYDALDRVLTGTDASGAVTKYDYDANGNLTKVTDQINRVWTMQYDSRNRPVAETDPLGRTLRRRFDPGNQVTSLIAPSGRALRYTYDGRGQTSNVTDALGGALRITHDSKGNVTSVVDQRGNTTTYTYDELYRPTSQRNALGQKRSIAYNSMGLVTEVTDEQGRRTSFAYDEIDRLVSATSADALVRYTYDNANRPTRIDDSQGGAVEWAYDDAGRVLSEKTSSGIVNYTYNDAGQRVSMKAADRAVVNYGYDAAGRLRTISQGADAFTYSYDVLSRLAGLARPNGVSTAYEYDNAGRLSRARHATGAGQALEDYKYTYTADNHIASVTSLASASLLPAARTASSADAANRLSQFGEASYTFNDKGQTTSKTDASGTTQYTWDARGRLTRADMPDGRAVTYGYDALGRLSTRTSNGSTTQYLYDGQDVVLDRNNDGSTVEYMNGGLDYKLRQTSSSGGGPLYFIQDHLGSTAALTDSNGSVVERQQYSPFGESSGSSLTRFGFTGREHDSDTGLLYYRARWYDSAQGRFISQDPAGTIGGFNFYAYAGNNPMSFVDPMGLSWSTFLEGLAVAGVTSFFVALGMAALFSALTCATAGTALAVLPPLLALIMGAQSAYEIAMEIKALLTEDMCPDELHYRVGALIGSILGGLAGGKVGSGLGGGCFVGGTPVHTRDGEKPIEEIKVGDEVLSRDVETGRDEYRRVTATETHKVESVYEVSVHGEERPISATADHPFYVRRVGPGGEYGEWVAASELHAGDRVMRPSGGWARVNAVTKRDGEFTVYNFTVEGTNTYYVGGRGALVHNNCELNLKYKEGWTPEQIAAANQKVAALNEAAQRGELTKTAPERSGTSASQRYRNAGNEVPSGSDVDHVQDLQLGGSDTINNMRPLDSSVNRSLGSQISNQIRNVPNGTPVTGVSIGPR